MQSEILISQPKERVLQFSVHAENKVGRLNDLVGLLRLKNVHPMALTTIDGTDSSIVRMIVNYHDDAREVLRENNFFFIEMEMIAVEMDSVLEVPKLTRSLIQAEINIHYLYPFLYRPYGKCAIAMRVEEPDLATETIKSHGLKILSQEDIAR